MVGQKKKGKSQGVTCIGCGRLNYSSKARCNECREKLKKATQSQQKTKASSSAPSKPSQPSISSNEKQPNPHRTLTDTGQKEIAPNYGSQDPSSRPVQDKSGSKTSQASLPSSKPTSGKQTQAGTASAGYVHKGNQHASTASHGKQTSCPNNTQSSSQRYSIPPKRLETWQNFFTPSHPSHKPKSNEKQETVPPASNGNGKKSEQTEKQQDKSKQDDIIDLVSSSDENGEEEETMKDARISSPRVLNLNPKATSTVQESCSNAVDTIKGENTPQTTTQEPKEPEHPSTSIPEVSKTQEKPQDKTHPKPRLDQDTSTRMNIRKLTSRHETATPDTKMHPAATHKADAIGKKRRREEGVATKGVLIRSRVFDRVEYQAADFRTENDGMRLARRSKENADVLPNSQSPTDQTNVLAPRSKSHDEKIDHPMTSRPKALGDCPDAFLRWMETCCDSRDEEETKRLRSQLLTVVDLSALSDSEKEEAAGSSALKSNRPMATCVLCDCTRWIATMARCILCNSYYHTKCAKEYGDENKCWNCELDGMIDDSEVSNEGREELEKMLRTLRGKHEEDDADMPSLSNVASNSLEAMVKGKTKSMKRWEAFLDDSTRVVEQDFQATTSKIQKELESKEGKQKYSKGFTTPETFQTSMAEVVDDYAQMQEEMDKEAREKSQATVENAASTGANEPMRPNVAPQVQTEAASAPVR